MQHFLLIFIGKDREQSHARLPGDIDAVWFGKQSVAQKLSIAAEHNIPAVVLPFAT